MGTRVDAVVVGAGFVGLAIARSLGLRGLQVLTVEQHAGPALETSSRNSEVIHAGLYYAHNSLKARLCVQGKSMLYEYCQAESIPFKQRGKLVVATSPREVPELKNLLRHARGNGLTDLVEVSGADVRRLEPFVHAESAVLSPSSGVVDTRAFVRSLERSAVADSGARFLYGHQFLSSSSSGSDHIVTVRNLGSKETLHITTRAIVNAAGLGAQAVASRIGGLDPSAIPPMYLAKGNYMTLRPESGIRFSHLVYPLPRDGGLGIHVTVDVNGNAKFGPNVEWLTSASEGSAIAGDLPSPPRSLSGEAASTATLAGPTPSRLPTCLPGPYDYAVLPTHRTAFARAIQTFCPSLKEEDLTPSFSGVRPKLVPRGNGLSGDFLIRKESKGVINLHGIESPGLTACLAIAEHVRELLMR